MLNKNKIFAVMKSVLDFYKKYFLSHCDVMKNGVYKTTNNIPFSGWTKTMKQDTVGWKW